MSSAAPIQSDPPGIECARLRDYLDRTCPGLVAGPLSASLISGGKSNLTYLVTDGRSTVVVRRPPLGHVLPTAHDMTRESRIITALRPTAVPVPRVHALCEDPAVLGAPFYVMERMPGTAYRFAAQLTALGPQRTEAISRRSVQMLAALHCIDPADIGLADFGRPEGFLERQVRRWAKQLAASHSRDLPEADELHELLSTHVPAGQRPAILHGDYRVDNVLVDERDEISAVLDWEMATLGDPLTDVALMLVYEQVAGVLPGIIDTASVPGYLTGPALVEVYAECCGRDLSDLGFYLGLAYFKLAAILEGIHYRQVQGLTVGERFAEPGAAVRPMLQAGIRAMRDADPWRG